MTSAIANPPFDLSQSNNPPRRRVFHKSNPVWGPLPSMRRDMLKTFTDIASEGDAVSFRVLWQTMHILSHPDYVKHVLVDNPRAYRKHTGGYKEMRRVVGMGLLTSDGDAWLRERRLASPAFHKKRIEAFADTMVGITGEETARWKAGEKRDLAHDLMQITLRIVSKTIFSRDAGEEAEAIGAALTVGLSEMAYRMNTPWALPVSVPTARNRQFRDAIQVLHDAVHRIIEEKRKAGPPADGGGDLLDMLMSSRDEATGESMNDIQLRDEVLTIMLAGHETTAMTLSWTLHLLGQHPEIEARVRAEVAAAIGDRPATMMDLMRMPLVDRVVRESMRLYPPAWIVGRACVEEDDFGEFKVKPGEWVFLPPWVIHRRPELWPEPERFDPDRFLPEAVAKRDKLAWIPFSAGQRKCIGDQFAMMEADLVLATLIQKFRYSPEYTQITPEPLVTLRPKGGLPMSLARA